MKAWHWLLADVFDVSRDTAWVASIFLLVLTVRGFLLPFNWSIFKSTRMMLMMRPEQLELEERYGASLEPEDVAAHDKGLEDLNKKYGYNPLAGCIPPLIQVPFFIGLYRLLIWMSVPESGRTGTNIGLLTPEDIAEFLSASFLGVPLPAYVAMSDEQFTALGTNSSDVRAAAIPLLIWAIIFTTVNMVISQMRTRVHMDWSRASARGVYNLVWFLVLFTPVMLGVAGMTGLIPIALLMYWFISNLWTLCQTIILWFGLTVRYPLDDSHKVHIRTIRTTALDEKRTKQRTKRASRRSRNRRRIEALTQPSSLSQVRREIAEEKTAEKQHRKDAKQEKKSLKKEKNKVRSEIRKAEMAERKRAKQAKSGTDSTAEAEAEEPSEADPKSSNPPVEPTASDAPDPSQ